MMSGAHSKIVRLLWLEGNHKTSFICQWNCPCCPLVTLLYSMVAQHAIQSNWVLLTSHQFMQRIYFLE